MMPGGRRRFTIAVAVAVVVATTSKNTKKDNEINEGPGSSHRNHNQQKRINRFDAYISCLS